MKKIEVFGMGCAKCNSTGDLIKLKSEELGVEIELSHISDPTEIAVRGIITTPAVVVDGKIVHKGGLPTVSEIEEWLK